MRMLVTGATGFFGRMFMREMLQYQINRLPSQSPQAVVAFARSESRLAALTRRYSDVDGYRHFLGDVRDLERLRDACRGVDVVVHAAALKRVDDGSYNPSEMIATNITGTQNVIKAATAMGVAKVIVVSSDKAVEPINVYGGTKFVAEQFAVSYNAISHPQGTAVAVVRYGNVLSSTGSVLHLWREQAAAKKPLTITSPHMTRFVMTARDAVKLVLRVASIMEGGEIVVPKLQSVKLMDMVKALHPGREIEYIGKRVGGEKLHEKLLNEDETSRALLCDPDIVVYPASPSWTASNKWTDGVTHFYNFGGSLPYSSDNSDYLSHTAKTVAEEIARSEDENAGL
jgi:UDP-N-acetylglucosamine 4,6-dehydratase